MALAKVGRKIKRTGKSAVQFKFTATFEYIDVECTGAWRPEELKVIWQRAHRKIESNGVQWQSVADRGPEGATGRALFNPPISVALIITLYRGAKSTDFEEKEYKFYIANEGKSGKKILASFHCNVANYAGIPNTKSALELDCKAVSKKVRQAHLGLTMESEYIKEGSATDDDMQSTYSHVPDFNDDPVMEQDSDEEETADNEDVKATGNGQVHNPGNTGQSTHGTGSEADQRKPQSLEKGVVSGKESGVDRTEGVHDHTTEPIPKSVVGDGERAVNEMKEHIKHNPVEDIQQNESHLAETKEKQGENVVETKSPSSPPDNLEVQGADTKKVAQGNEQQVDSDQPQTTPNEPHLDAVEPSIHDEETTKEKHDVAEGWRSNEKSSETHEQPKTDEAGPVDKVTSPKSTPESLAMVESMNVEDLSKWLPPTTQLVNANNEPVAMDSLFKSKVFGLYFTAMWCPPCRKFIPKLVKFNEILKDNNARFSIVYVSSDHTEDDMLEHLSTNNVSFPAIKFSDPNCDKLREKFGIRQVPHLVIVDSTGKVIDDRARKVVEVSQTGSSAMHCYGKWLEGEPAPREKKGVLVSLFSRGTSKKEELTDESPKSPEAKVTSASNLSNQPTSQSSLSDEKGTQMKRIRVESHMKSSLSSVSRETNLLAELEEKSSIIRDLEVKNEALEQRISDLTEENQTLKSTIEEQKKRLQEIQTAQSTLLEEKQSIVAKANMKGFLLKRGVRGPTGRKWRRRFFRTDGAGRLCYYKIAEDTTPLGFIELENVIAVKVAPDSVQDKNHCTFEVVVEGRTFELLAMNEDEMTMWIDAIKYLSDWHKKNVGKRSGAQLS